MAYRLMKTLIEKGKQGKEQLVKKANVYYAANQLTDEEYEDVIRLIDEKYAE